MTTLPRSAAPELAYLRSDNQSSRLYLTLDNPATIYSALLAGIPTGTDKIAQITYDNGSGTYTNIKADMTILIGSTAGGAEYGIARVRNITGLAHPSGTINIAETSSILWVDNAHITIIDDFDLCPRHIRINPADGTTPLMDYDVPLGAGAANQNTTAGAQPTPIMGSHAVLQLRGATVTYQPDASSSWVKDGMIGAYAWVCAGATFDDATSATPIITFSSVGNYRLELTVTGDNGVAFTGYRRAFVVTESSGVTTQFEISQSPSGDYSAGGWSFGVTLYDEATLALVRDRALVILHAVDYYGDTPVSLGYVAGCENIIAIGRIAAESIVWGTEDKWGSVTFTVQGPQYWLSQMTAFPAGVKDSTTTPNKWTKFLGLTLNKAWYHFMAWRTTATRMMDVYPIADSRRHKRLEAPGGENIWSQLIEISKRSMLADPCCDRYGRLFLQIEQQLVSDRSSMPIVQALTSADWYDEIGGLDRVIVKTVGLVDMSGTAWDGTTVTLFFALSPGHVFDQCGAVEVVDRLMLTDQAATNTQAGLYSAWKNNEYPRIEVKLASNHRLFDIAPYQRFTLAIAAADTPRGIAESLTIIPRSITYEHDAAGGYSLTTATFEAEVTAALAVTGDTPAAPPDDPIQPVDPPVDPPPIEPGLPSDAREVWASTNSGIVWSTDFFTQAALGAQPTWHLVPSITAGTIKQFYISEDGSTAYIYYSIDAGIPAPWSANQQIYKCTNLKDATPTWTLILNYGAALSGSSFMYHIPSYNRYQNKLIVRSSGASDLAGHVANDLFYGEYNGSAWAWTSMGSPDAYWGEVAYQAMGSSTGDALYSPGGDLIRNWLNNGGVAPQPFRNYAGEYYISRLHSSVNYIHKVTANTDILSGYTDASTSRYITGAGACARVSFVTSGGILYLSDDGATFTNRYTWQAGLIGHAKRNTIGPLVWLGYTVGANNEFIRINLDGTGRIWTAMTGNIWSLISGGQTFTNLQLVY